MFPSIVAEDLEKTAKDLEFFLESCPGKVRELTKISRPTFSNFCKPYQEIHTELSKKAMELTHLDSVCNSERSSSLTKQLLPKLSEYYTELGQNEDVYRIYVQIQKESLTDIERRVIEKEILDFHLTGISLPKEKQFELKEIRKELSLITHEFSQNVLNATNSFEMILDEDGVKGLPPSMKDQAREKDGSYKITLQGPSYTGFLNYAADRSKREELFHAYATRAPENGEIMVKILDLRFREAKLLGYEKYTELSLATKMAKTPSQVLDFLRELAKKSRSFAQKEKSELTTFAATLGIEDPKAWDIPFLSERLKERHYAYNEEMYRPYFEKNAIVKGTLDFLTKLLKIEFKKVTHPTWHPTVDCYEVIGSTRSLLYLDLEARKEKKGGAWMNSWVPYYIDPSGKSKESTAVVVANFPSSEKTPSLLKPSDLVTFFHEMGHALHHLLSKVPEPFVSGVNGVEWDAVEFPSQFLESFALEPKVLRILASHHITKEPIPEDWIKTLQDAKHFQAGMMMVRQLEFALFDFLIHDGPPPKSEAEVQKVMDDVRSQVAVWIPPSYQKMQNSFTHIFSGGYAAGYYSYKWAELLSANAFFLFHDHGIFSDDLATRFRSQVLEMGASKEAMEIFKSFYGKEPEPEPLLRWNGILN